MLTSSMTGFGSATREDGARRVAVDVRTLNHRYLKINVKMPRPLTGLEPEVDPVVRRHVARGAVTVSIRFHDDDARATFRVDHRAAQDYRDQIAELYEALGCSAPEGHDQVPSLLALPGVVRAEEGETDDAPPSHLLDLVLGCVDEAMTAVVSSRQTEGAALRRVLDQHSDVLEKLIASVNARAADVPRLHRDKLVLRVQTLLNELDGHHEIDGTDLHRELCLLVDKSDVTEEINRLETHLGRFREILTQSGEAGRQLDFLLQEMLRETNTIGSKANDAEVAHAVVEMKVEVERMKEQVQNVE